MSETIVEVPPAEETMLTSELVESGEIATEIAGGTCGDSLTWTLDADYVLTISGVGAMDDFTSNTQPWEDYTQRITAVVIADGVTSVGEYAFFHCYDIASVVLPDSITRIGMNAFFYCCVLPSIDLPDQLKTIGNYAFGACYALTAADLPEGLISIGDKAFSGCELTSALIPEGVTSIGEKAFLGCPLTEVSIPASLTSIGAAAFQDCTALEFITVAPDNPVYRSDNQGAMYTRDYATLIVVPGGFAGKFSIPGTVTHLESDAIRNCDALDAVTIPDSVTTAGESIFYDCDKLNNVVLSDSMTKLSGHMFGQCENLCSITIPDGVVFIGNYCFSGSGLETITFRGDAPEFGTGYTFSEITATAYYPAGNVTWTEDILQDYGGDITWVPYDASVAVPVVDAPVVTASNVASSGKIKLSWDAVDGASKYQVYRATSKTGAYKLMKTVTGTSYTNTTAKAGKYYYYNVVAVDAGGNVSEQSNIVGRTCDLARPVIKLSNVASTGKVKVTWDAVDGAVSYKVYRATSKTGKYLLMKTVTGTSYTNTKATAGETYYYKVIAVAEKSAANSAYSAMKYRTCDLARPVVSIALNSKGKPKLSWSAVDGAVKYEIYRSTSKTGTYKLAYTASGTSYTNSGAASGTTYYYKVIAVHSNTAANSAYSGVVSIKTK